eukprot:2789873-Rhodomonas_salina.1
MSGVSVCLCVCATARETGLGADPASGQAGRAGRVSVAARSDRARHAARTRAGGQPERNVSRKGGCALNFLWRAAAVQAAVRRRKGSEMREDRSARASARDCGERRERSEHMRGESAGS